jgi:hypothetical protein
VDSYFRRAGWLFERCEEEDLEVLIAFAELTLSHPRFVKDAIEMRWWSDGNPDVWFGDAERKPISRASFNDRPRPNNERLAEVLRVLLESRVGRFVYTFDASANVSFLRSTGILPRLLALLVPRAR